MRRNGLNPQGLFALHPRCGKIRADVDRRIIQNCPVRPRLNRVQNRLFGSGFASLGRKKGAASAPHVPAGRGDTDLRELGPA